MNCLGIVLNYEIFGLICSVLGYMSNLICKKKNMLGIGCGKINY